MTGLSSETGKNRSILQILIESAFSSKQQAVAMGMRLKDLKKEQGNSNSKLSTGTKVLNLWNKNMLAKPSFFEYIFTDHLD